MICRLTEENLSAYIDGALGPSDAMKVREHLDTCPGCRQEYEELMAVIGLVRELPELIPPPGFSRELRQRLEAVCPPVAPAEKRGFFSSMARGPWSRLWAVAATLLLTVGLTYLWYGEAGRPGSGKDPKARQFLPVQDTASRESAQVSDEKNSPPDEDMYLKAEGLSKEDRRNSTGNLDNDSVRRETPDPSPPEPEVGMEEQGSDQIQFLRGRVNDEQPGDGMAAFQVPPGEKMAEEASQPMAFSEPGQIKTMSPQASSPASGSDKKFINKTEYLIEVDDLQTAVDRLNKLALDAGSVAQIKRQAQTCEAVLRLPDGVAGSISREINGLGDVVEQRSYNEDITGKYNETVNYIELKINEEQRLINSLNRSEGKEQELTEELGRNRNDIEEKQKYLRELEQDAGMITFVINLTEK